MSCRSAEQWRAALAYRFDETASEPADTALMLAHLQDCERCRALALAVDPSLLFQSLRDATPRAGEVEDMRAAVAGLRRAAALRSKLEPPAAVPVERDRRFWLGRAAAAALLAAVLGTLAPAVRRTPSAEILAAQAPALTSADGLATGPTAVLASVSTSSAGAGGGLAVAGDVGRPSARVYEIGYSDMSVVMVVDKSLDL